MPARTHAERATIARIASYERWSRCDDRSRATEHARRAFWDRFDRDVDPDGVLPPEERAKRAEAARKAYFARLGRASGKARRRKSTND